MRSAVTGMSCARYGSNAHSWPSKAQRSSFAAAQTATKDPKTLRDLPRYDGQQPPVFRLLDLINDPVYFHWLNASATQHDRAGDRGTIAQYLTAKASAMESAWNVRGDLHSIIASGRVREVVDHPATQAKALAKVAADLEDVQAAIDAAESNHKPQTTNHMPTGKGDVF